MWTDVIPGVIVAAVMFIVPGASILLCCRVGVPTALLAAPPVSLGLILLSTLATALLDAAWDVRWVAGTTAVCALVAAAWTWGTPWGRRGPRLALISGPAALQYLAGQVIALLFMVPLYLRAFVDPTTIAQRYDNAFHLNAIEAILRTGEATPFDTGALLRGLLYPNGWHTAGALVRELSGLDLPQAVHALMLTTVLGVWPMAMWLLVEQLVRPALVVRMLVGPLLLALPGFPLVLLDWGLVYPTILGLAVVPVLAAVLVHAARGEALLDAPVRLGLIIAAIGVGAGIAHPGSALVGLIIVLPIAAASLVRHLQRTMVAPVREVARSGARHTTPLRALRDTPRRDVVRAAVLAAMVLAIVVLWAVMSPSTATAPWTAFQSTPQALGEIAFGGSMGRPAFGVVVLLSGLGIAGAALGARRHRVVLLAMLGPGLVYWASSAAPDGFWRDALAGFLYRDSFRAAAALTVVAVPLATMGLQTLAGALRRAGDAERGRRSARGAAGADGLDGAAGSPLAVPAAHGPLRAVAGGVVGALLATLLAWHVSSDPLLEERFDAVSEAYRTWEIADLVSTDEFEMFEELPEYVPEDGYLIVDPWEGGGLAYALGDREVNRLYMTVRRTPDERHLDDALDEIATDPTVCESLPEDRPLYYLDLDDHRLGGDDAAESGYLGFQDITDDTAGFDLVHEVGEVRLYEVTAC
ncbi:DUF6541 family protein [Brachybacterium sp. YJGR34]|uniref:DUF6541 family protein n=1 Tax=Brachybacterium sp. YJGR34 TaxID=2059911 RepID=UPI000E0ABA3B|nr:DUF6541 family protein [Brachybacterium sp. YJGR34]